VFRGPDMTTAAEGAHVEGCMSAAANVGVDRAQSAGSGTRYSIPESPCGAISRTIRQPVLAAGCGSDVEQFAEAIHTDNGVRAGGDGGRILIILKGGGNTFCA